MRRFRMLWVAINKVINPRVNVIRETMNIIRVPPVLGSILTPAAPVTKVEVPATFPYMSVSLDKESCEVFINFSNSLT